ncbi:FUSC family protein [Tissierella carlieri]|uniref:FUSC family protein n=1 Tax=Tissierella carlieri TaxID=689904 RepID=UPI001C1111F4|nr:aromatic acid exporter family protein [Tissierella carlieri]MBU5312476.1 FUSC family protein [Tissierella carlieri]
MGEIVGKKHKKVKFLGMRVVKTVIAVYICFLISFFRNGLPFYSAIAAILCMQNDHANSLEVGKGRMIGTFIGGIYGFLAIILINFVNVELFSYIHHLILSLFLIPIIYTNVFLKSNSSTYISCVVFFSITISHGGDIAPMYFALNRVIDTLIGIAVSLIINMIM